MCIEIAATGGVQPVRSFKIRGPNNRLGASLSITCTWHDSAASTVMSLIVKHYGSTVKTSILVL